jgi:hypothetical protein
MFSLLIIALWARTDQMTRFAAIKARLAALPACKAQCHTIDHERLVALEALFLLALSPMLLLEFSFRRFESLNEHFFTDVVLKFWHRGSANRSTQ